jgi:putative spermidine/putrescine transport system ATP-binding protein
VELRQLQQRLGVTTVVVTHDQKEALTMADVLIVMDQGRVQQMGAPMDLYRDPANAFVAGFIGSTNLLPCRLSGRRLDIGGHSVDLTEADRVKCPDGPAVLSVRPEDVRFADMGLPARVTFIRDLGESVQFTLDFGGREVNALFAPRDRPAVGLGDTVHLGFEPGRRVVLAP